ncbi:putative glycoside hydrolase [Flammeovirga agarivorans]|uniref:T9SS type A sorting domain-containing protein n=1 Tax=Flammeovirga agarivorans TaxID=2726742 RepID=A0A7X8SNY5_9BACT|nr:putative glycoside hydrolase [Flammeovirga agarivorans]NLR93625.1 T9SS type A sorting domain-containing protein [Flammeovirga agarivorans]
MKQQILLIPLLLIISFASVFAVNSEEGNELEPIDITIHSDGSTIAIEYEDIGVFEQEISGENYILWINNVEYTIEKVTQVENMLNLLIPSWIEISDYDELTLTFFSDNQLNDKGVSLMSFEKRTIENTVQYEVKFPDYYPNFSWNHINTHLHFHKNIDLLNEEEVQFVAHQSPFITLEKTHAMKAYGSTEKGIAAETRQLKRINPNLQVLYYWNGFVHYDVYEASEEFQQHPEWVLEDSRETSNTNYDLTNPEMRSWWVQSLKEAIVNSNTDGVFVDALTQITVENNKNYWGEEKFYELGESVFKLLEETRSAIGDDKIILVNGIRSVNEQTNGTQYADYVDAFMIEHFAFLQAESKENILLDLKAMDNMGKKGKMVLLKAWPGWYWRENEFMDQYSQDELIALANDNLDFPLGCFLMGMHEYSYILYGWGYAHTQGWMEDYEKLKQNFGKPLSNFKKEGWILSREFENGKVMVDLENKTATFEKSFFNYYANSQTSTLVDSLNSDGLDYFEKVKNPDPKNNTATFVGKFKNQPNEQTSISFYLNGSLDSESTTQFKFQLYVKKGSHLSVLNHSISVNITDNDGLIWEEELPIEQYNEWINYTIEIPYDQLKNLELNTIQLRFDTPDNDKVLEYYLEGVMGPNVVSNAIELEGYSNKYGNEVILDLKSTQNITVSNDLTFQLEVDTDIYEGLDNVFSSEKRLVLNLPKPLVSSTSKNIKINITKGSIVDESDNKLEVSSKININNKTTTEFVEYYNTTKRNSLVRVDTLLNTASIIEDSATSPIITSFFPDTSTLKFTRGENTVFSFLQFNLKKAIDLKTSSTFSINIYQKSEDESITDNMISCYLRKDNKTETQVKVDKFITKQDEWDNLIFDFSSVQLLEEEYNQLLFFFASPDYDFDASNKSIFIEDIRGPELMNFTIEVPVEDKITSSIDSEAILVVYPNPSSHNIMYFNRDVTEVYVYNLEGKLIFEETSDQMRWVNLQKINSGIFLVKVRLPDGKYYTQRWVKQ